MNTKSSLRCLLASTLACTLVLQAGVSYADDTEIFFGGSTIDTSIQPNVLFVLDNSGSMADPTVRNGPAKMTQLKSAFNTIISNAGKINVGVMSMNTSPRLITPVQDINASVNVNKLTTPAILDSGDDATYNNGTASTNIADKTLVMGYVKNADAAGAATTSITRSLGSASAYDSNNASYYVLRSGSTDYVCSAKIVEAGTKCTGAKTQINASTTTTVGNDGVLLFRNLNIPKGVTILTAKLILKPVNATAAPALIARLENTKTAAAFNSDTALTTARDFSVTALRTTSAANMALVGGEVVIDIKTALTALTNIAPAANPIADMAVRVRGNGTTSYPWYIGNGSTNSPRLEVTWSGSENVTRTTGIRFQNVAIPKGATILSARIDFVPAASDDRPVTYAVSAQNVGDAGIFTTTENFTSRTKVATTTTWTPDAWRTEAPQVAIEGPVVTDVVQDVINSATSWCGNNSMAFFFTPTSGSGSRTAFSVDAGNGLQPVLNVKYSGGDTGCLNPILNISIVDPKDDASQTATNQDAVLTTKPIPFTNDFIGVRYQQVPVLRNATVMDAQIIANPNNTTAGTTTVAFENVDNSTAFSAVNNDISSRNLTSGAATCTFSPATAGVPLSCTDTAIKTQLQSIFNRSGWADGNSLSVILKPTSSAFALKARDTSADVGLKLRVKIAFGGLGTDSYTVRDLTNGAVQALNASGGTPIVPTLLDAARYMTQTPGKHSSTYASPLTSSCQANFVIFLTDGEANGNPTAATDGVASLTDQSCLGDTNYDQEKCARTLVTWMNTTDQATFEGLNNIKTSTIGFNVASNAQATALLADLARLGGGRAYAADNASDLTNAFDDIVQSALATNTSFVSASAPVNTFTQGENRNELYLSVFRPSETDRWAGNLKRYRMDETTGVMVDADGVAAIDSNTGFFKSSARSYWSTGQDGNDIAQGGAAHKLPAPASRNMYTYTGTIPSGTPTALESLLASNTNITKARLGDASMDDVSRTNLISYIRGGPDGTGTTAREALGDPIHSSPRLVTYACTTYTDGVCTTPDTSVIMGSNEGFIHAFSSETGVEQFAYMPVELLPNIKQLRDNTKSTSIKPRLYGMDNTVSLWVNDANNNGVIYGDPSANPPTSSGLNSGEFVYAYATMGRGGRNIYALDITNRSAPKLLWEIKGGSTTGFEKLAQTWSVPYRTKIKVGSTITDVLIFGGGYDKDQDSLNQSNSVITEDDIGNAIYIVNAKTGALIWSASNNANHTANLTNMRYSMPGSVRVIDLQDSNGTAVADPDRLADQFFIGDMGGQVWRFYINNGSSGAGLVTPAGTSSNGVFASVGGTTAASARRFYVEPDVAILKVNGSRSLAVSIGSGYRGHPLNEIIRDRFYAFRTDAVYKTNTETTLTEADLYDATQNLIQTGSDSEKAAAKNAFNVTRGGWYISLGTTGEKVISRALTAAGITYFNTYEPTPSTSACSASVGKNRYYAVRLADGTPASVAANGNGTAADRWTTSNSGGIAGDPTIRCINGVCRVYKDTPTPPEEVQMPPMGKTYWIDQSNLD